MRNLPELDKRIANLQPSRPIFEVHEGRRGTGLRFPLQVPVVPVPYGTSYDEELDEMDRLIKGNYREDFDSTTNKFVVSNITMRTGILSDYRSALKDIIMKVCPAKKPRQTKFYKEFYYFMDRVYEDNDEFDDTVISLVNYYNNNQKDMSPDMAHGKNMYNLLQALVKKFRR